MGLDKNGARFLLYCRTLGVDLARTAMIGRQSLRMSKDGLKDVFNSFGYRVNEEQINSIFNSSDGYAEQLLKCLGAHQVHSFDHSGYEGATHLHDMNRELPDEFKQQYTAVLDGGSLEHIFNFPIALRNCMEMVHVGGHFLAITPANNFFGHGFYQFSPELYFNVFTPENGFETVNVIAFEDWPDAKWYSVQNPLAIRGRVTLINSAPVYLLVVARKIVQAQIFERIPQQSDYAAIWRDETRLKKLPMEGSTFVTRAESLRRIVPAPVKRMLSKVLRAPRSGFDPRYFQPLDPTAAGGTPGKSLT